MYKHLSVCRYTSALFKIEVWKLNPSKIQAIKNLLRIYDYTKQWGRYRKIQSNPDKKNPLPYVYSWIWNIVEEARLLKQLEKKTIGEGTQNIKRALDQ
jgi:hypothetical protein